MLAQICKHLYFKELHYCSWTRLLGFILACMRLDMQRRNLNVPILPDTHEWDAVYLVLRCPSQSHLAAVLPSPNTDNMENCGVIINTGVCLPAPVSPRQFPAEGRADGPLSSRPANTRCRHARGARRLIQGAANRKRSRGAFTCKFHNLSFQFQRRHITPHLRVTSCIRVEQGLPQGPAHYGG